MSESVGHYIKLTIIVEFKFCFFKIYCQFYRKSSYLRSFIVVTFYPDFARFKIKDLNNESHPLVTAIADEEEAAEQEAETAADEEEADE